MHMKSVDSSQIAAIGHDPETNTMAVQFKNSKGEPSSTYHYANCTQEMHDECLAAESIGVWFGATLKPNAEKYPFTKQQPKEKKDGNTTVR